MSQPEICSPDRSAVELRSARQCSPFVSSSSSSRQSGTSDNHHGANSTTSNSISHSKASSNRAPSSRSAQDTKSPASPTSANASRSANAVAPPRSLTRLNQSSPLSSSLSLPVIARQHVEANTTNATRSGGNKRDSASLLASKQYEQNHGRQDQKYSISSSLESQSRKSTSSASTSPSSASYNFSHKGSVDSSSSESVASSVASTASSGLDWQVAKDQDGARDQAHSPPNVVALQPPAPPSNASDSQLYSKDSGVTNAPRPSEPQEQQHQRRDSKSYSQPPVETSAIQHTPPTASLPETEHQQQQQQEQVVQQQQIPTIEQRDALSARVYDACRTAGYDEWLQLLDLAPLASQHHLSGYNCIKFGFEGSPYAYLPLTLQQPAQTHELLERQKVNESSAIQWLAEKRKRNKSRRGSAATKSRRASDEAKHDADGDAQMKTADDNERAAKAAAKGKCESCCSDASESDKARFCECGPLKNEAALSSEWEAPMAASSTSTAAAEQKVTTDESKTSGSNTTSSVPQLCGNTSVKTSDTHPISISPIIPLELLTDISAHVQRGIPASIGETQWQKENYFDSDLTDVGHHQLQVDGKRLIRCRVTQVDLCEVAFKAEQELIQASQQQRKPRLLALHAPQASEAPPLVVHHALASFSNLSNPSQPLPPPFVVDRSVYCETRLCHDKFSEDHCKASGQDRQNEDGNAAAPAPDPERAPAFAIGNLLMSSCPGKKVRLTGPVRGRGAICRDLGLDLTRISQIGVGAIVCCLDDEELKFLGAPWHEYEHEADKLGVEVIRLPMAEGFSPTDVVATDKAISCVVNDYTLRGVHVLVHCRGGVGRAGLIACMWMLKLGLVRSDRDEMTFRVPMTSLANLVSNESAPVQSQSQSQAFDAAPAPQQPRVPDGSNGIGISTPEHDAAAMSRRIHANGDVMQTVHRLIETIRRRRSPKAIETAEQVCFLVKYLTYLHEQERQHLRYLAAKIKGHACATSSF